jgi:aminoglycoside phosphotransferase (APT) family kinase protein
MTKIQWEELPTHRRTAIEEYCGPIIKAETVADGLMPGLAARLHTSDGPYFLKAVPANSPAAHLYARERAANTALPSSAQAPSMLWSSQEAGWLIMLFSHVDGHDADLSPGSPDLPAVLATLRQLAAIRAWHDAPPVIDNIQALQDKAAALLSKQLDGDHWSMYADAIAQLEPDTLHGTTLLHYDLHAGNLKVTNDGRVYALDWSFSCAGAPWIDAALLLPRLIEAGHSPAAAETLMATLPAWHTAPAASITALAALWTAFREYKALYGPEADRAFRTQAAQAGRAWLTHRTT